jgi:quercetin dioxygenase-like cupin family protein
MALCGIALSFAVATATSHAAEGPGATALASIPVVELPSGPIYWHLDTYRTRAEAEALSGPRSTVVEAFAKVWLFTIAEAGWRPAVGVRVATVGPLQVRPEGRYTASYMQAATSPGFQTDVHQHGGPEALLTLSGEVCVETPEGKLVGRAGGDPLLIKGGIPMQLTSVGREMRRSLVLILHDAAQPWKVPSASPWTPKGLCARPNG